MNGLKTARKKCKMTIQEVADKLGVSKQTISAWEKGTKFIPEARKRQLSQLFGISDSDLGEITEERAEQLEYIASGMTIEVDKYKKFSKKEHEDRLLLYADKINELSVYSKISEEKEKQKRIEKSMHNHFSCNEAAPIGDQLSFIERANALYSHFDNIVDLLYQTDSSERDLYNSRILEFLYAIERELGVTSLELDQEESGLTPSINGVQRATAVFKENIEKARDASKSDLDNSQNH